MTAPTRERDDLELVVIDDDEPEFVLEGDQLDAYFSDDPDQLGVLTVETLVAAAPDSYDGGMIALKLSDEHAQRLVVADGLPLDDLHLTLCYLGDSEKIVPETRQRLIEAVRELVERLPVVDADAFAIAAFNPTNPDRETCLVALVSGDELVPVHDEVDIVARTTMGHDYYPEQHQPWIPHITLTYTNAVSQLAGMKSKTGPIRFDRICLAFAGEKYEFPLFSDESLYSDNMVADGETFTKERDVNTSGGGGHNLRDHWTKGEGAAEIGWGTKGDFTRCVAKLGDKVSNPQGLCAEYHKRATGKWPGEKKSHAVDSESDCGCEESIVADGQETTVTETGEWEGILAVEGIETGDQRKFAQGALKWAEPPIPLMWAPANNGAHNGSVMAGRIEKIWRDPANPAMIRGRGTFDLNGEHGREAYRQVKDGFLKGISIDPDSIADPDIEMQFDPKFDGDADSPQPVMQKPSLTIFHGGRIRAATLVQIPAFVEAQIALANTDDAELVAAATTHMSSVVDTAWSAIDMDLMLEKELPLGLARAAFAYVGPSFAGKVSKFDCRFLHHEINDDGTAGEANLTAVNIAMGMVNSSRVSKLDKKRLKNAYTHLAEHMKEAGIEPPKFAHDDSADELVACGDVKTPPREWFDDPKLAGPTPFTVTDDGRVFGHAALWGACHTSFANSCVTPPFESDYGYFTTGEVICADGSRVAAGQITLGTSHAATRGITAMQAIDHYGDTGTAVADVAAGSDDFGIWVAGSMRPGVSHDQLHALRASALSGDWRRLGGNLRMVALLAVNVPGFPVPRTTTAMQGDRQLTLVAAGVITEDSMREAKLEAMRARVFGSQVMELRSRIFDAAIENEFHGNHNQDSHGNWVDKLDVGIEKLREKVTGIKMPKRYGPNGERNFPLTPDEKPTPERVLRKQDKESMKRILREGLSLLENGESNGL